MQRNVAYVIHAVLPGFRHEILVPLVCIAYFLVVVLLPVETRWARTDILLSSGILAVQAILVIIWLIEKCFKKRLVICRWNFLDISILFCSMYYALHIWFVTKYPCGMAFLKAMELVALYYALRVILTVRNLPSKWINAGVMACAVAEAFMGVGQIINGTSRHSLYLLSGSFQNPGPYSAFLMLGIVIGLAFIPTLKIRWHKHALEGIIGIMIILLSATWSRAALVSLGLVGLLACRDYYWRWRWAVWTACLLIGIAFYFIKKGSADGRVLTWAAALMMWYHHPWTGMGIGSYLHANACGIAKIYENYPNSQLFTSGGVTDYAFSDLLKILVEQGLVGEFLIIITIIYFLILLWKHDKPLFYGALSLLSFSMFSYPFQLLPYRIIAVIMAAWVASVQGQMSKSRLSSLCPTISLLLIIPLWMIVKEVSRLYEVDKEYLSFAGKTHEAFIKDYYELLPYERDNACFLFDFAKNLRSHGRFNDSNTMLRQGTIISSDPMFYIIMGNNYKDMGYIDLAENAYNMAFSIMPNRIYPFYQLMNLFIENEDMRKAKEYAQKVVCFKEKIKSPATEQMKKEANDFLNSSCL